jgi:hypothetical protein
MRVLVTTAQPDNLTLQRPRLPLIGRMLLYAALVASIPAFFIGLKANRARHQRQAVKVILALGGDVRYDRPVDPTGKPSPPGPAWIESLLGDDVFVNVTGAFLSDTSATDADLARLRGLTHLGALELDNTAVTDAGLVHLRRLTSLASLSLRGTKVTEAGVEELQRALPYAQIVDATGRYLEASKTRP